jgi:glucose-1-phosphate cytidylyltransferase
MKVVILAGGFGTRISEESVTLPKPLVEIGGMPILWHIMKIYAHHGLTDFVICCGYKGHLIKRYFLEFGNRTSDFTVDLAHNTVEVHRRAAEPWRVTLVDTGEATMTGGRIKRIREHIGDEPFCMTYGDGVSDIDVRALIQFHEAQKALATVTAVAQPGRFGALDLSGESNRVRGFREKSDKDGHLINGGFFVLEPEIFDYIAGDETVFEQEPLRALVAAEELAVYRHTGFWQNMDTLRDKHVLERYWESGNPPWRIWDKASEGRSHQGAASETPKHTARPTAMGASSGQEVAQ